MSCPIVGGTARPRHNRATSRLDYFSSGVRRIRGNTSAFDPVAVSALFETDKADCAAEVWMVSPDCRVLCQTTLKLRKVLLRISAAGLSPLVIRMSVGKSIG